MKIFTSILIAFTILHTSISSAQPGTLDSTFGENGKVITHFGTYPHGGGFSSALQADGKIVVAGASSDLQNSADFAVARYQVNGELDSAFGVNGKVTADFDDRDDRASSVDILPDGKILVTGVSEGSDDYFSMVRYMPTGLPDSSFGVNGKVLSDFFQPVYGRLVAIQADGKIVVEIFIRRTFPKADCALARYNSNGKPDSSFGVNGVGDTTHFNRGFIGEAMTLQPDGRIVIAGYDRISDDGLNFAAVRFNQDGKLDSSFGENGNATMFSPFWESEAFAIAIQSDGKIITAGYIDSLLGDDFALVRYTINGNADSSFGLNGATTTNFGQRADDYVRSVAIQSDGKIIATGQSGKDFALARYTQDGQLDSAFGENGKVTTDFENGEADIGYSVTIQADGKIIVAGQANNEFALARYNNDEVLPVSLIDLKAYAMGGNVRVEWTALNELNISQYNIERSLDGKRFNVIGNVKALADGQQKINYSYADFLPAAGDNFYRIESVSKDGIAKYIDIVKVNIANRIAAILFSPNPVKDVLHIQGLSSLTKTISLLDVKGKLLRQVTTANTNYSFNTKQFAAGIYFVRIDEGKKTTTLKFIKE